MSRTAYRLILLAFYLTTPLSAGDPPSINSGAVGLSLQGSLQSAGGNTTFSTGLRALYHQRTGIRAPLLAAGIETSFSRVRSLRQWDNRLLLALLGRSGNTAFYPYGAITLGVRQEWLGSFRLDRYSSGILLGLHLLAGDDAGLFVEYSLQHIYNDPLQNFNEQRLQIGLTLFLRNRRE